MDGSSVYHVRSISMPSRSHPIMHRVEEELRKLKTCVASSSSPSSSITAQMMCNGLMGLENLYDCVDDLLRLPSNQQALSHPLWKKWVEEQLDGSVKLLDLCRTITDMLVTKKEQVQNLQSSLRRRSQSALRRRGDTASENKAHAYIGSEKKVKKDIKKCLRELKQMDDKCGSCPLPNKDCDSSMVATVLIEAREITISVLHSIFPFLSTRRTKPNASKWSFVSKAMHKRKVACEEKTGYTNEMESIDASLFAFYQCISCKGVDGERSVKAQNQLEAVEVSIEGLESGLECLFRRLIQKRVALLNILSL